MNKPIFDTEKFDFEAPIQGHRERFKNKVSHKSNYIKTISILGLVASFTLIAIFNWPNSTETNTAPEKGTFVQLCSSQELQDIEFYYSSQELERIDEIKSYNIDSTYLDQEILTLDSIVQKLCLEMGTNPSDERVIGTAVSHYQKKIKTLDHIIQQLKNINPTKEIHHEEINL